MKTKPFIVANVREVLDQYDREEISFSKMVEMLNEIAEKFYKPIKFEPLELNNCGNCKHKNIGLSSLPCVVCIDFDKWQPK